MMTRPHPTSSAPRYRLSHLSRPPWRVPLLVFLDLGTLLANAASTVESSPAPGAKLFHAGAATRNITQLKEEIR